MNGKNRKLFFLNNENILSPYVTETLIYKLIEGVFTIK